MTIVPEGIWQAMLDEFAKDRRDVEQVCYFDGLRCGDESVVTTLTLPNATVSSGQFQVTGTAMSEAGRHFRSLGMVRLAQIHTHPQSWTGHSGWDDAKAYSQMPGAISIVLPYFGRNRPTLRDAGFHLRTEAGWTEIEPQRVADIVRIVPSILDFRPKIRTSHDAKDIRPPRRRPWWSFFAFWRN